MLTRHQPQENPKIANFGLYISLGRTAEIWIKTWECGGGGALNMEEGTLVVENPILEIKA